MLSHAALLNTPQPWLLAFNQSAEYWTPKIGVNNAGIFEYFEIQETGNQVTPTKTLYWPAKSQRRR